MNGDRAAILHCLAGAVARQQDDPVLGGFEVVRLLLLYGVSWIDLFPGPAYDSMDYMLALLPAGYRTRLDAVDYGRGIRTLLHLASPFELATWAVLVGKPDPNFDDLELLRDAVKQLLDRLTALRETI